MVFFPAFQTRASVALQTTKDCTGLLRPLLSNEPSNWHKDTFFDLHSLLRSSENFRRLQCVRVSPKRGLTFHGGATPLKGALLPSLRYQWTIYLFKYLISVVPVCREELRSGVAWESTERRNFSFFHFLILLFKRNAEMLCFFIYIKPLNPIRKSKQRHVVFGLNWR